MIYQLTPLDLSVAAMLVIAIAALSFRMKLAVEKKILIAACRTALQLSLIGFVLNWIFNVAHPLWILVMTLVMLLIAGAEVMRRQKRRFTGWWGYGVGATSMFISSFSIMLLTLKVIVHVDPWYKPQYCIPMLGMLLGNTMTAIALGLDRLTQTTWEQRQIIETRLTLGQTWQQSIHDVRRDSLRSALIPLINTMSIIGLVSLPGMMTGQILAGNNPLDAVKYQILIMYLIASGAGFGSIAAIWLGSKRLFDQRHRLRLDRLSEQRG